MARSKLGQRARFTSNAWAVLGLLAMTACGSDPARRRVPVEAGAGSGGESEGTGGAPNTGGVRNTGGTSATGGAVATGGATSPAGGAGGRIADSGSDAKPDVSVPDDSGAGGAVTQPDATADAAPPFVPAIDAGSNCELPVGDAPLTPEQASLPAAGLVTWLRGDHGVYKTPANAVCAWVDQSGSGHVFTPATVARRPLFVATGIGNQPAISFDVNQELVVPSVLVLPAQSARTLVAVEQHVSTTARFEPIYTGTLADNHTYVGIDANTFNTKGSLEGVYMHGNAYDSDLATSTERRVHVYVIDPMTIGTPILSAVQYRVNGVLRTLTRTPGGTGNGNFETFAPANRTMIGHGSGSLVSEVLVYDHALSAGDVAAVEAALKTRYAIP